jgi:hypothetical protein
LIRILRSMYSWRVWPLQYSRTSTLSDSFSKI